MLSLILLVVAFVLALVAAWWPPTSPPYRPSVGWLSLAVYFLNLVLAQGHVVGR